MTSLEWEALAYGSWVMHLAERHGSYLSGKQVRGDKAKPVTALMLQAQSTTVWFLRLSDLQIVWFEFHPNKKRWFVIIQSCENVRSVKAEKGKVKEGEVGGQARGKGMRRDN